MFGAIFLQEMLVAGRRHRGHFLRWIYAVVLLAQIVPRIIAALFFDFNRQGSSALRIYAAFFETFAAQHFFYLLVLAPALAAGAIADEKMRGTLDYLLTTCLNPAEIVLGKALARFCQIMMLVLVALPILAFFGVMGDLDAGFVVALVAASAVVVFGATALSLLASVWCRRTRDAVLCTYLVLFAGFAVTWATSAAGWEGAADVLSPWRVVNRDEAGRWTRLGLFAVAWLVPAAACLGLASWRLRPASEKMRHGDGGAIGALRWIWRRERVMPENANPCAWREQCVQGLAPMARLRAIPTWLAAPVVGLLCAAGLLVPVFLRLPAGTDLLVAFRQDRIAGVHAALRLGGISGYDVAGPQAGITLFVLTLLLAVRASGAVTEERERATWDALLLTPLTTQQIVRGKFFGLLLAGLPYLIAYCLPTLPIAFFLGAWPFVICVGAAGVLVISAPWILAVGLCFSAMMRSSWRSLLATVAGLYGYVVLSVPVLFFACVVTCFVNAIFGVVFRQVVPVLQEILPDAATLVGGLLGAATLLIPNAVIIAPLSWLLLLWAERIIERGERAHVTRQEQATKRLYPRLEKLVEELAEEEAARDRDGD